MAKDDDAKDQPKRTAEEGGGGRGSRGRRAQPEGDEGSERAAEARDADREQQEEQVKTAVRPEERGTSTGGVSEEAEPFDPEQQKARDEERRGQYEATPTAPQGPGVEQAVGEAQERAAHRDNVGAVGTRPGDPGADEERAQLPSTAPEKHRAADSTGGVDEGSTLGARTAPAGSANSGPGTQVTAPPELETSGTRPPARTVTDGSAPIEAPDAAWQTQPLRGLDESSTNHVAANAGMLVQPGEDHVELVDENGAPVDPEELFTDPDPVQTFVMAKQRLFELFRYPGASNVSMRQLYTPGARVDRLTAERIKSGYRLARNAEGQARMRVSGGVGSGE